MLLRNNITLLVSDMAGTVINEKGLIYTSLKKTLKRLGYCVSDADMTDCSAISQYWVTTSERNK